MSDNLVFQDLGEENLERFGAYDDHEIVRRVELADDIVAFIAVHNTNLGPGLGGCRMRAYKNEDEAIRDVLRLSRGMTYKNAVAGLPLGGGKAVIIGNPRTQKTTELMEAMGKAVNSFDGGYVTAEDSGTGEEDMVAISCYTDHVTGLPPTKGADENYGELGGNPSPVTALGCYHGIKAAIEFHYGGERELSDMHVTVQGVGAVGLALCELLKQDGARLTVTDISQESLDHAKSVLGDITIVAADDIYGVDADIFAPCAMGGSLNDDTIAQLNVDIVAGVANNQLLADHHDQALTERNILYVPDYVINSGGVICVSYEYFRTTGYNPMDFDFTREAMLSHVERIGRTVFDILTLAEEKGLNTGEAADALAEKRFLEGGALTEEQEASIAEDQASSDLSPDRTVVQ